MPDERYRLGLVYCTVCGNRSARKIADPRKPWEKDEDIPEMKYKMTEAHAADVRQGTCVFCGGTMDVKWLDE